ncbi:MAG: divergent polysaccharide deacetylase family protein [Candidatus Omnitrophota bacterium]
MPWPVILIWIVVAVLCIQGFLMLQRKKQTFPSKPVSTSKTSKPPVAKLPAVKGGQGKIAIILDDWGFNQAHCKYFKSFNAPVAPAVMPDLPYSNKIIECAIEAGQQPILHLPLEPHVNKDQYPKGYVLTTSMSSREVSRLLVKVLNEYPGIVGVNNHMGSKATENKPLMTTIITELKKRKLFFIDSVTSGHSICAQVAGETGIRFSRRDIFLDNRNERAAIEHMFEEGVKIAHNKGFALMIGHDRALTLQIVQEQISKYKKLGYEFVSLQDYIKAQP